MISAHFSGRAKGLAKRLAGRAEALAIAHAEQRLRRLASDDARWRAARLLWPLF